MVFSHLEPNPLQKPLEKAVPSVELFLVHLWAETDGTHAEGTAEPTSCTQCVIKIVFIWSMRLSRLLIHMVTMVYWSGKDRH